MRPAAVLAALAVCAVARAEAAEVVIGSKAFTESVVLGELVARIAEASGVAARHRRQLGGTRVLWQALKAGEIDLYAEYTGTIGHEILAGEGGEALADAAAMRAALARHGVAMTGDLGFNNSYALGMRAETAARLGIAAISDLGAHPELRLGFSNEFMDRADGWPALRAAYRLAPASVTGLDHDLAYRGLDAGSVDVVDLYSTDAEIAYYGLAVLADNRGHFPAYRAVILYRQDLERRAPALIERLALLEGAIDEAAMSALNARVKIGGETEARVAADFAAARFAIAGEVAADGWGTRLWRNSLDHLALVAISLSAAIVIAIPLGVLAARRARAGHVILAAAGVVQTIPSLALFVFMIPLLGIGGPPAVMALFLYSLLPIIRNTHAGLAGIPADIIESAAAIGLAPAARLRLVELPLAGRAILAGIKTSAVINVGTATLGALIGAGGYGQPILTGIRLDDTGLILEGAVPAALLALAVQGAFELAERLVVPRGLRLAAEPPK